MAKTIKIISNPYKSRISFEYKKNGMWEPITINNSPNTKLLETSVSDGFFPLQVESILGILQSEYLSGASRLNIVFEGPSDEYEELVSACSDEQYSFAVVEKSEKELANARDVLPAINKSFDALSPLLVDRYLADDSSVEDISKRFQEVTTDEVPICVVGNYSTGKSSLINALIGRELLPDGAEPTTSRVYEIRHSKDGNRGSIVFQYGGMETRLDFEGSDVTCIAEEEKGQLFRDIEELGNDSESTMFGRMRKALQLLNEFGNDEISELVQIRIPFNAEADAWFLTSDYIIFDTPGSNSASYKDHGDVLHRAMGNMSNGLPIVVSTYESMDSNDNEELFSRLKKLDALDSRFAVFVLNKADASKLPAHGFSSADCEKILHKVMPSSAESVQRLYFVSSIVGLGAKNDGIFNDEYSDERFSEIEEKYSNPDNRHYKQLYKYNILPRQMKKRAIQDSELCRNQILANSGVWCLERDIELFALRYSAYNKCMQAKELLAILMEKLEQGLDKAEVELNARLQENTEEHRKHMEGFRARLDAERKRIVEEAHRSFDTEIDKSFKTEKWYVNIEHLHDQVEDTKADLRHDSLEDGGEYQVALSEERTVQSDAQQHAFPPFALIERVLHDLDEKKKRQQQEDEFDEEVSKATLNKVSDAFVGALKKAQLELEAYSKSYWLNCVSAARCTLSEMVMGDSEITETDSQELAIIISEFPAVQLEAQRVAFDINRLREGIEIFIWTLFKNNRLNLAKLEREYNDEMGKRVNESREAVSEMHQESFVTWIQNLVHEIDGRLTELNPGLRSEAEGLEALQQEIKDKKAKLELLKHHANLIAGMTDWR